MAGDHYQHRTAWAGAGNGVLVFDMNNDGVIDQRKEVVFTDWDPTAASDMQALANVFDTNHNGLLDAGDAQFAQFKLLVTKSVIYVSGMDKFKNGAPYRIKVRTLMWLK